MDNKNQNKLNSKDLELNALEMLNKAADSRISDIKEKEENKENKVNKEEKEVVVSDTDEEMEKNVNKEIAEETEIPEQTENEIAEETTVTTQTEENKETPSETATDEEEKNADEETIQTDSEESSVFSEKQRTKEDVEREDAQTEEELRNLITTAIENKRILRKARIEKDIFPEEEKAVVKNTNSSSKKKSSKSGSQSNKNGKNSGQPKKKKTQPPENSVQKTKAKPIASDEWTDGANFDDEDNQEIVNPKKKGFFSKYKKTKITIIVIISVMLLIILAAVGLFFRYMGLLNRKSDDTKNYSSMPVNESDLVSEDDTFDKAKKEEELKARLAKTAKPISETGVTNILLIGEDVRDPKETGRGNTDVMMIVSINEKNKTITLTSLLRDVWVYLDEYGVSNKLNAAYWHGGSKYLEKVVEQYYGIEIDRYVSVNFLSFIDIVEAVGGLDFDVKANEAEAMKDPLDEVNDILGRKRGSGYVKAGKQHLDGYQALAYSRIRYNCGDDYGRTKRQRAVIAQIIKKSKKLSFLEIDSLLNKVLKKVTTDVTNGEAGDMVIKSLDYMNYRVQQLQVPAAGYFQSGFVDGLSVLLIDQYMDINQGIIRNVVYGTAKNADEAVKQLTSGTGSQAASGQ